VVGKGMNLTIYEDTKVEPFLASIEGEERRGRRPGADEPEAEGEGEAAPAEQQEGMDTD